MAKTLEQIDREVWPEPEFGSHLVATCHALRKKPIDRFTTEDLRIMIAQNIGVEHLIPYALKQLRNDPLASGDFYEGDLFVSILRSEFVRENKNALFLQELVLLGRLACEESLRLVDEEIADSFGGFPSSDFGIDRVRLDAIRAQKISELEEQEPWRTVFGFLRSRDAMIDVSPV